MCVIRVLIRTFTPQLPFQHCLQFYVALTMQPYNWHTAAYITRHDLEFKGTWRQLCFSLMLCNKRCSNNHMHWYKVKQSRTDWLIITDFDKHKQSCMNGYVCMSISLVSSPPISLPPYGKMKASPQKSLVYWCNTTLFLQIDKLKIVLWSLFVSSAKNILAISSVM